MTLTLKHGDHSITEDDRPEIWWQAACRTTDCRNAGPWTFTASEDDASRYICAACGARMRTYPL